jgi:uncharacterized protein YraI
MNGLLTLSRRLSVAILALAVLLSATGLAQANAVLAGSVDAPIGLNLRAGPGLTYRVQVVLKHGQSLELLGRSSNGQWLEARLPESGLGGWVFADYVKTSGDTSALPVTEAAGGPTGIGDGRPAAAAGYSLYVTIADNVATVYLQKYPANAEVAVKLGRTQADQLVASGKTDANGEARIAFNMPARWADGSALASGNLKLAAQTLDGTFSRSATIVYVR